MAIPAEYPRFDDVPDVRTEAGTYQDREKPGTPQPELLRASDITWRELADATWLTSFTHHPEPSSPPRQEHEEDSNQNPPEINSPVRDQELPDPDIKADQTNFVDQEPAPQESEESYSRLPGNSTPKLEALPLRQLPLPVHSFEVSAPGTLRDASDIVRALRSLKRKVKTGHEALAVLDEVATAERAVQDGLWVPVTKPGTTRWLDLTLVVDTGPSMTLWRSTVKAFTSLMERLGAFRTVQVRLLETNHLDGEPTAVPRMRGATPGTPVRDPGEILDPSGRRVVLVLTDGVGQSWQQGLVSPLLVRWAKTMPTAIVHTLPERLWNPHTLDLHRARLTVPGELRPNRDWGVELPDAWLDLESAHREGVVPVPVLELRARWLGWWADLITANNPGQTDARVLLASDTPVTAPLESDTREVEPSAAQRVRNFMSVASTPASRLATLLAAVPVSVPVARLLQHEFVPESDPAHLTEVLTSGLLHPADPHAVDRDWDQATFEFPPAVREVLLSGARRSETALVVNAATTHFGDQVPMLGRLRNAIAAPDSTPDPQPTPETAHEVALERMVLRALSGPYLSRADRLQTTSTNDPVSEKMPQAPERAELSTQRRSSPISVSESPTSSTHTPSETDTTSTSAFVQPVPPTGFQVGPPRDRGADGTPAIWGNVPPRNPNFTGRRDLLEKLGERLSAGTTAVLPAAVHGMGGIGKTQMAVEYIYRHMRDYDIVWWIQATQPSQIRLALTELALKLRLPGSAEANTAVPAVLEALRAGLPDHKWLLVFDSAESPEIVRPFFPTNGPGEILVTSRNSDWAGIARPLEVAVFDRTESKELLRRRGPEIADAEADQLAEKLGDLPLAIEQAAAWRAQTGMPVDEYLRLFDEKVAEILDTSAPTDYDLSVAAAWNVSFDELRTRDPAAHQLLQICAFFAPEPISRHLFTGVRGISISPELDEAFRNPMQLGRAIRSINRYGLAKIDHRNDTLVLHRLVQAVLRNRMTPQHRAEMRHGAHLLLANLDPNDPTSSKQWMHYQEIMPHAFTAEIVECEDQWVRQLVLNLMKFLYQWGDHEEATKLAETAHKHWTEKLGEDDPQTLEAAGQLSFYYWVTNRYAEGEELNRRTLELRRRISGENSEETFVAQNAVGRDLKARGDFMAARELSRDVYEKTKALFGEDDPQTLDAARAYGISLRLCGEYRKAAALDEESYNKHVEIRGYDNSDTLSTYSGLIMDRREAGDYVWARKAHEELAERAQELFGEDNADTLRRFAYLAVALRKAGDHVEALKLSGEVLERFTARYGKNNFNAMACSLGNSIDQRHAGELGAARRHGEKILELYRKNLGELHPYTLAAAVDLAVTLRLIGDVAAARQLNERSLEKLRAALGPDHPHSIVCAIDLASDLAALGETQAALELETEALDRSVRSLGNDHPTSLAARLNRALDLRALGQTEESKNLYTEVLTQYRHVLGDNHPGTKAAVASTRADCDIDPLPL